MRQGARVCGLGLRQVRWQGGAARQPDSTARQTAQPSSGSGLEDDEGEFLPGRRAGKAGEAMGGSGSTAAAAAEEPQTQPAGAGEGASPLQQQQGEVVYAEIPDLDFSGSWGYQTNYFTINRLPSGGYAYHEEYPDEWDGRTTASGLLQRYSSALPAPPGGFPAHYYIELEKGAGRMWVRVSEGFLETAFCPLGSAPGDGAFHTTATPVQTEEFRKLRLDRELELRKQERQKVSQVAGGTKDFLNFMSFAAAWIICCVFYINSSDEFGN